MVDDADSDLERLVELVAEGDESAWHELWRALEPRLSALARKRTFVAYTARPDEEAPDVVVTIMARLRDDGYQRLHQYLAARRRDPRLTFMRWLIVVARRVAIDVMRAHPDYVDRRRAAGEGAPGAWIEQIQLPAASLLSQGRPPVTIRIAARQVLRYAGNVLPTAQRQALEMWTESGSCDEIAKALQLASPEEAERLVRAAVERLRRHFRAEPSEPGPAS